MSDTFRVSSRHPEDLVDGKVGAPGDEVKLTNEQLKDPSIQRLVDEGKLIKLQGEKDQATAKARGKTDETGGS